MTVSARQRMQLNTSNLYGAWTESPWFRMKI